VTSAAVAGVVLTFVKYADPGTTAIFFYPVGLAYGALCNTLGSYIAKQPVNKQSLLGMGVLAIASLLLLSLFFVHSVQEYIKNAPSALELPTSESSTSHSTHNTPSGK
jgi:hypothetical protein